MSQLNLQYVPRRLGNYIFLLLIFSSVFFSLFQIGEVAGLNAVQPMLCHILLCGSLIAVIIRYFVCRTERIFWNEKDNLIVFLAGLFCCNVYYSEMRGTSWQMVSYLLDAIALYFIVRLYLYKFIKLSSILLTLFLCYAYFKGYPQAAPDQTRLFSEFLDQHNFILLFFSFWALSFVFIMWRRITALHVVLFIFVCTLFFSHIIYTHLSPFLAYFLSSATNMQMQNYLNTFQTSFNIISAYPLLGSGLGTFPFTFEAFRTGAALSSQTAPGAVAIFMTETGLLGLIMLLCILIYVIWNALICLAHIRNSGLRLWICIFLAAEIVWFISFLIYPDCMLPFAWALLLIFQGFLTSLINIRSSKLLGQKRHHPAPVDFYLSIGDSLRLCLLISFVFIMGVLMCAPAFTYRSLVMEKKKTQSVETSIALGRITARFPYCQEAWVQYATILDSLLKQNLLQRQNCLSIIQSSWENAIKLSPYEPDYYIHLAQSYNYSKERNTVLNVLLSGVSNNPNDTTLRLLFARELALNNNNQGAIRMARGALLYCAPGRPDLHTIYAEYLMRESTIYPAASRNIQYSLQHSPDTNINASKIYSLSNRLGIPTILLKHCL